MSDIYRGLEPIEEKYSMEFLHARLAELQQEMKSLVRQGMKAGVVDEKEHSGLKIGQVAKSASVNIETIRYYERLKLIPKPERTESGYRVFSPDVVQRISFIKRSQNLGLTLAEIQELLALTESGERTCEQVKELATQKLNEIELKIQDLQKIRNLLAMLFRLTGC